MKFPESENGVRTDRQGKQRKKSRSQWENFFRYFVKHRLGMIGLIGVLAIIIVAVFAPSLAEYPSGYGQHGVLQPPDSDVYFGTDHMGMDIFAQVVWGTRTSLHVGFMAVMISVLIGVPVGIMGGYFNGWTSNLLMGMTDIFLTLPMLPLMIVMAASLGSSINNIAIIIGILSWPRVARIARADTLSVRNMEYISAAKAIGSPNLKIFSRHILPNISGPILVNMTIVMATAILSEAGLSFLGLGDASTWSWGRILENAHRSGTFVTAWWYSLFPSFAIMFFVISFNFIGMGIREALNPKLNR
ncbi:MAG: ABC transporter permease [Bacillota bacterium]